MKKLSEIKASDTYLSTHITQSGTIYIPTQIKHPTIVHQHDYSTDDIYLLLLDNMNENISWKPYIYVGENLVKSLFVKNNKTSLPIIMAEVPTTFPFATKMWQWLLPKEVNYVNDKL